LFKDYNPEFTIKNIAKFLKDDGLFCVVLPYPDIPASDPNEDHRFKIHCGIVPLGLHINDNGQSTCNIFKNMGFDIIDCKFYSYKKPEIYLKLKKIN
jgi:hypothetical protein